MTEDITKLVRCGGCNAVLIRKLEREYGLKFQSDGSLLFHNGEEWVILRPSDKDGEPQ